jgi:processing peptidase subunit alpha
VIGANLLASASREQMAYTVDVLKTHVPEAVELLADAVLNPKFELHELNETVKSLTAELAEAAKSNPQAALMEALHETAYSGGLGRPLLAPAASLAAMSPDDVAEFVAANYTAPRMVLAGSGVSLEQLAQLAEPLLGPLPGGRAAPAVSSPYVGGDARDRSGAAGTTRMALAFHFAGGWRDVRGATAMTVLQLLLGGGESFSAGGPGKGMYSRLYTRVLNKHAWAHSCTGFHTLYNDSGLVGIHAACDAGRAGDMADTLCKELQAVASAGGITAAELARAKTATISSVLMNLESRAVVAEDIGRQVLTYGARKAPAEFVAEVEKLTVADLAAAVAKLLKTPPTFVASGELGALPRAAELAKRF